MPVKSPLINRVTPDVELNKPAFVIVFAPSAVIVAVHLFVSAAGCEIAQATRASEASVNSVVSPTTAVPAPVPQADFAFVALSSVPNVPSIMSTMAFLPAVVYTVAMLFSFFYTLNLVTVSAQQLVFIPVVINDGLVKFAWTSSKDIKTLFAPTAVNMIYLHCPEIGKTAMHTFIS